MYVKWQESGAADTVTFFLLCIRKRAKSELSSRSKLKRKFQKAALSSQYQQSIMAASGKITFVHPYSVRCADSRNICPISFNYVKNNLTFIHKDGSKNLQNLAALHQFTMLKKNIEIKKVAAQQFKGHVHSYLQTKNQMRNAARAKRMRSPTITPIRTPVFRFAAFSLLVRKSIRSWWPFRP